MTKYNYNKIIISERKLFQYQIFGVCIPYESLTFAKKGGNDESFIHLDRLESYCYRGLKDLMEGINDSVENVYLLNCEKKKPFLVRASNDLEQILRSWTNHRRNRHHCLVVFAELAGFRQSSFHQQRGICYEKNSSP